MLKYLVVLLDDTAVSYCHYDNPKTTRNLISLSDLKAAILFSMKENLMLQFVYPAYELPQEYMSAIETMSHCKIMPAVCCKEADIVVMDCWEDLVTCRLSKDKVYVLRTGKKEFFDFHSKLEGMLTQVARLNVILTDVETFTEADFDAYKPALEAFIPLLSNSCRKGTVPQLNLLTDRMMLDGMNNCNAGWESVTLAPDGDFYACPAFYLSGNGCSIGSLSKGISVKNPHLYRLEYAPLCRHCDAYQCKRCVWLNRKMTLEVNTPSREQCVTAHLERNASRDLLQEIRRSKDFLPNKEIKEIGYLDPFDIRKN